MTASALSKSNTCDKIFCFALFFFALGLDKAYGITKLVLWFYKKMISITNL